MIFCAVTIIYLFQLNKPLEIISIVGCSVSLVAVVITVAVFLIFWRELKSPGVKVLLNLSAAIAVSCALVIFEGSARNKVCVLMHAVPLFLPKSRTLDCARALPGFDLILII